MQTTIELLDAVKTRHGIASDYAAKKLIGVAQATISNYRVGKQYFDDAVAIKVAELLDLDPSYVLACIHAERAKRPDVKHAWERLAKTMSAAVFTLFFVGFSLLGGSVAKAADGQIFNAPSYTLYEVARRLRRWILGLSSMAMIAAMTGCGAGYAADTGNHGFGYRYDAMSAAGMRLRYDTTTRAELKTPASKADWFDAQFADVERCTQLNAPAPLVIVVPAGTTESITPRAYGLSYLDTQTVLIDDEDTLLHFTFGLRHEFVHIILAANGFPADQNNTHLSPLFDLCSQ